MRAGGGLGLRILVCLLESMSSEILFGGNRAGAMVRSRRASVPGGARPAITHFIVFFASMSSEILFQRNGSGAMDGFTRGGFPGRGVACDNVFYCVCSHP